QDTAYKAGLDKFLDKLINEKGLSDKDPEVAKQIKADLWELLDRKLDAVILTSLPEEKLLDFETLIDAGDPEAVKTFITANIANLDEVIARGLLEFRQAYI
ncbi:MAG: DUF5663 domain-containing protein, partial [Candidatus Falkowbacteria bacterium]|nr:DUF5663 domain-containing protein [Candidatus Falkowbacteria bacterium]